MTTPQLIGSVAAGQLLGKSPRTIHRLVEAGALVPAHVAPGGRKGTYLFHLRDVERLAKPVVAQSA